MADDPWQFEDWGSNAPGTAERLAALNSHIAEVTLSHQKGSYSTQGKSHNRQSLEGYLRELNARRDQEYALQSSRRSGFTQGRML